MSGLSDLPVDIFLLICNHLDATSFVRLTLTCRSLYHTFSDEPTIWSRLIRDTFRVANQPVVEHDGARWKRLYRKLRTQTRAYTWGSNSEQCLGQNERLRRLPQQAGRRPPVVSWPEEMDYADDMGIISEMQCGGWSTSLLNSAGVLRISGVLDGMVQGKMPSEPSFTTLTFPPGWRINDNTPDASCAIRQYSHGRQHLLALSDSGRIWSWNNSALPAYHVKFLHHTTIENRHVGNGSVKKVVAGWNKSTALIEGSGIVVWDPLVRPSNDRGLEDTALVQDSEVVPDTDCDTASGDAQYKVRNYVVLEGSIMFITSDGQLYCVRLSWDEEQRISQPRKIELDSMDGKAVDIQGSFRSFAIFTDTGSVLIATQEQVAAQAAFQRIIALQHTQVIAIAFGDYHYHALHAPGYITSYGKEPQSCGAFGLGANTPEARLRGIRRQGIFPQNMWGDSQLVPHAYIEGRQVWFEREKRDWIKFLASGGVDPEEAIARMRMALGSPGVDAQGEISAWVEQEGRDWESKYGIRQDADDGLPTYFALNVAAAGWHSGALILEDTELAQQLKRAVELLEVDPVAEGESINDTSNGGLAAQGWTDWLTSAVRWFLGYAPATAHQSPALPRPTFQQVLANRESTSYGASPRVGLRYAWADQHFPRLTLTDGTEMPGTVPFDSWRYGRPDWRSA